MNLTAISSLSQMALPPPSSGEPGVVELADNNDGAIGYSEQPVSLGPTSVGATDTDLWEFDGSAMLLIGIGSAWIGVLAGFALRHRYANLWIGGDRVSGFMPARSFSKTVLDAGEKGLRIFYGFDEIQKAWKAAPEDGRDRFSQDNKGSGGEVFTITRGPFRNWWIFAKYGVDYQYSDDGQLNFVDAYRQGGLLGGLLYRFIPYRELPSATPPEGKQAVTQIAEIGDEAVALKVHELAQGAGEEIKIYPTVDDFRLALGEPEKVTESKSPRLDVNQKGHIVRTSYWRGTGQPADGETIALGEATQASCFFTSQVKSFGEIDKIYGAAYSTGIMEVTYDMQGRRVSKLEPGKRYQRYHVYQVRYNYGKDGRLLRTVIFDKTVELDPKSLWGIGRRTIENKLLFTCRPGDAMQRRDSSATSDRAELALSGPDRDVGAAVREIRKFLDTAYQKFKDGEPTRAAGFFGGIAGLARREGLKAIETAAHVASGDMSMVEGGLGGFAEATIAYNEALSVLEGEEFREAAKTVAALKTEAENKGGQEIVRDIWNEMRPEEWLFRDPLAHLEGGVARETLKDAVPLPEAAAAEVAARRATAIGTRREVLEAYRARRQLREAARRAEKR